MIIVQLGTDEEPIWVNPEHIVSIEHLKYPRRGEKPRVQLRTVSAWQIELPAEVDMAEALSRLLGGPSKNRKQT